MDKRFLTSLTVAGALILAGCGGASPSATVTSQSPAVSGSPVAIETTPAAVQYDAKDSEMSWDADSATKIQLNGDSVSIEGSGVVVSDQTVTINQAGLYILTGKLNAGQILINAPKTAIVRLVLNGVDITGGQNAAIYCMQANKLIVTAAEGSENILTDAADYTYAKEADEEPDAALFSKVDLTINGTGRLTVNARFNNGIGTKDDLVVIGTSLYVTAINHGIRGRDSVSIISGTFEVNSGNDAIQSNNEEDSSKGWIAIEGGVFTLQSGHDGIQAQTALSITDGQFSITAGGSNNNLTADSFKGLKGVGSVHITAGSFSIDSADDAIHSNGSIVIQGGDFTISTGDDGIHADGDLTITDGLIKILTSYEGLEAATMTLAGGQIELVASDDGINIAGGNDSNGFGPMFGGPDQFVNGDQWLFVSGGIIVVDAKGDGIDINGNFDMTGGQVTVYGPTSNGDGALDFDGSFNLSGGTIIAGGSAGMAQSPSSSSTQPSIMIYFTTTQAAGTVITLLDADGQELIRYTAKKNIESIVLSGPQIKQGSVFTLYSNGQKVLDITPSAMVTSLSDTGQTYNGGQGGRGGGNMDGPRPGR